MLFNSLVFVSFFILVYALYISLHKDFRKQNILLLIASYTFYGYWDWRFLLLLWISTIVDYAIGLALANSGTAAHRKKLLALSLIANLSILGFFKYFNFFADTFSKLLTSIGMQPSALTLNIILPVGISFYTFQTLSYTFDVYRGTLKPSRSLLNFALFVAFFPQLVAGPIERAAKLLPQVERPRTIAPSQVNAALFLIIWGYFKKVFVADNVGLLSDRIFNSYTEFQGIDLFLGSLAFAAQIYCDFSGYSDIARGLAKLMGFELMVNFRLPYFARNPSDFWSRWHVSLSTWLRDYLYIPLGGNRNGTFNTYRNLAITMLLGGLWHGAAWNFVLWGAFHGLLLILYRLVAGSKPATSSRFSAYYQIPIMFALTLAGWIIFRSQTVGQIVYFFSNMSVSFSPESIRYIAMLMFYCAPLACVQLYQYLQNDLLAPAKLPFLARTSFYALMLYAIFSFGARTPMEFIYFQF